MLGDDMSEQLLKDLAKAKVAFQLRALTAALGLDQQRLADAERDLSPAAFELWKRKNGYAKPHSQADDAVKSRGPMQSFAAWCEEQSTRDRDNLTTKEGN